LTQIDYTEMKKGGFIKQRQENMFAVRLRTVSGNLNAVQLKNIACLAEKYGRGHVHVTTRQGIEIPFVSLSDYTAIKEEIKQLGLTPGTCGPRIRAVVACPGNEVCQFGLVNSQQMGAKLDELFFGREVSMKTKLAVSGCPNSCAKPQENDFGFVGAVEPTLDESKCIGCGLCAKVCPAKAIEMVDGKPLLDEKKCIYEGNCIASCPADAWQEKRVGYIAYAGGKVGRFPRLADQVAWFVPETEVPMVANGILAVFEHFAKPGERIADLINRIGREEFIAALEDYRQSTSGRENDD